MGVFFAKRIIVGILKLLFIYHFQQMKKELIIWGLMAVILGLSTANAQTT